jgi:hypothetical protein
MRLLGGLPTRLQFHALHDALELVHAQEAAVEANAAAFFRQFADHSKMVSQRARKAADRRRPVQTNSPGAVTLAWAQVSDDKR